MLDSCWIFQLNVVFRTLCVLGGGICRPRVNGLARVDERGVCFVVVPIKYNVGVRHALIAPQSYDVRVHVYTYSKTTNIADM